MGGYVLLEDMSYRTTCLMRGYVSGSNILL